MLFPQRVDFTTSQSIAVGGTYQFKLSRLFHIELILVKITCTLSANIGTPTADGLYGLLKRATLTVAHGTNTRTVVNCSGRGLCEFNQQVIGGNDYGWNTNVGLTGAAGSGNTYTLYYPIWCSHPQMADPLGSFLLLPAPDYNDDPVLSLEIGAAADVGSTFAISAGTAEVYTFRREVIGSIDTINWELVENEVTYASSGNEVSRELAIPGHYTGLLLRSYSDASTRANVFTNGASTIKLAALGQTIRRFKAVDQAALNDYSRFTPTVAPTAGAYYLDFLSDKVGESVLDLGSCLDTNPLAGTGAKLELLMDITGGAAVKVKFLHHRLFGDLSKYKLTRRG